MTTYFNFENNRAPATDLVPASRGEIDRRPCPTAGSRDGRWHLSIRVADKTMDSVGRRVLFVTDELGTVLTASSGPTMRGARVVQELETVTAIYGLPSGIVTDHDSAFSERVVHEWAYRNRVAWFYEVSSPRPRTWKL